MCNSYTYLSKNNDLAHLPQRPTCLSSSYMWWNKELSLLTTNGPFRACQCNALQWLTVCCSFQDQNTITENRRTGTMGSDYSRRLRLSLRQDSSSTNHWQLSQKIRNSAKRERRKKQIVTFSSEGWLEQVRFRYGLWQRWPELVKFGLKLKLDLDLVSMDFDLSWWKLPQKQPACPPLSPADHYSGLKWTAYALAAMQQCSWTRLLAALATWSW